MSDDDSYYKHEKHAGNHGDCFKHTIFCNVLTELQKVHPEGLILADTHAGNGVYDVSSQANGEYKLGIGRILQRHDAAPQDIPPAVATYVQTVLAAVGAEGCHDFELYPGSPLLAQTLLRENLDEHRLTDLYVEQVEGLNANGDGSNAACCFQQSDAYDPATLDFLMPADRNKHPVVLIDAGFKDNDEEYGQVKQLLARVLERNPKATVLVWIPFLHGHRFRWSFATGLRELAKEKAKVGRYYANIVLAKSGFQGSAMLVCNPTPLFDDVVDPKALHWLAHVMNQGKDEYTVEQIMKKKKPKSSG